MLAKAFCWAAAGVWAGEDGATAVAPVPCGGVCMPIIAVTDVDGRLVGVLGADEPPVAVADDACDCARALMAPEVGGAGT